MLESRTVVESDLASAEKCDALDLASFSSCATAPGVGTIQFCESYVIRVPAGESG